MHNRSVWHTLVHYIIIYYTLDSKIIYIILQYGYELLCIISIICIILYGICILSKVCSRILIHTS